MSTHPLINFNTVAPDLIKGIAKPTPVVKTLVFQAATASASLLAQSNSAKCIAFGSLAAVAFSMLRMIPPQSVTPNSTKTEKLKSVLSASLFGACFATSLLAMGCSLSYGERLAKSILSARPI